MSRRDCRGVWPDSSQSLGMTRWRCGWFGTEFWDGRFKMSWRSGIFEFWVLGGSEGGSPEVVGLWWIECDWHGPEVRANAIF